MTDFPTDLEEAVAAYAAEHELTRQQAVERILRNWLTGQGYLSHGDEGRRPEELNASNDG